LSALTNTRQGQTEDITAYVRRFKVVCTRYVGTLLNDETIRHYFIQGFDRNSTQREVLARRPRTLEDAVRVALEVEIVDKESDRMEKRFDDPISSFILLTHRPNEPLLDHHSSEEFRPNHQDLQWRTPQQAPPAWNKVKKEIQYATKGMKDEFMRNMQSLNEQMAMLVRTHKSVPSYYKSGPHTSRLWCTNVGCPDPVGHTSQFCLLLLPQQPHRVPLAQHQPQPAHVQPYQPPHRARQAKPIAQSNARPQPTSCPTCGKIHAVGRCWIENNVICGNCGGQHPTDRCRRPDKIMELQPPPGDYPQQARKNQRGARVIDLVEPSGPSNL
jgi:hypothetical protein